MSQTTDPRGQNTSDKTTISVSRECLEVLWDLKRNRYETHEEVLRRTIPAFRDAEEK
ncbi:hypothetical protein [Halopelagius fulvigenes]|uniref:CopG family transcriptional regulator n=1 Tax=Halopelagius fulvigenes TaxID=1198324 RepID=A0ABD5TYJ2_9EURY